MSFVPGTIVKLLSDVTLAKDYNNTFSWLTLAAQTAFFNSKVEGDLVCTNFTYQREKGTEPGKIRFPANAERLQGVNYLMFQNANFGTRWYYAFIDAIEYINDGLSEIIFKIDSWQTYYFDLDFKDCLIGREHDFLDTVGANRIDEGLDIGDLTVNKRGSVTDLSTLCVAIMSTWNPFTSAAVVSRNYSGIYSGAGMFTFSLTNLSGIDSFIADMVADQKLDAIVGMFMYPKNLVTTFSEGGLIDSQEAERITVTFDPTMSTLDGYAPKNNKLLQYPYTYLYVTNSNGGSGTYRMEDFYGGYDNVQFIVTGDIGPNPTVYLLPYYYKTEYDNFDESMALSQYPFCAFTYDVFKDYLAKNIVTAPLALAGSALSLGAGIATGNPLAIAGGAIGFAQTIGGFVEKSMAPPQSKGTLQGSGTVAIGAHNFLFFQKCVKAEQAKMIDDFFSMYGYKVNRLAVPTRQGRPHWNYLQLIEVNVFGSFPLSNLQEIRESLRRGITFWHDDNVGNYNRSNKY